MMTTKDILAWHFLPKDGRTRFPHGKRRFNVRPGLTLHAKGLLVLCENGMHASRRAISALCYAPGPIVCRVRLSGEAIDDNNKICARSRTVLWMADATATLHEFACRCAEAALRAAAVKDGRCWAAIQAKRNWLAGRISDAELGAARDAAWDAAWAAAWAAARDAARAAARSAACGAARDAQNRRLTAMLSALKPKDAPA